MRARLNVSSKQREEYTRQADAIVQERIDQKANQYDAMVLWVMHVCFKFGKVRLKRYLMKFKEVYRDYYISREEPISFGDWCIVNLMKIGIDIEQWNKEN